MKKITDNTALKYANAIKQYCNECPRCEGCVFAEFDDKTWERCALSSLRNPCFWELKEK